MKNDRNINSILLAVILCIFTSCEKDPWVYDTERKNAIYIMNYQDTISVLFDEYCDTNWMRGYIGLHLLGVPEDYDRTIEVEFVDSNSNINFGTDCHIEKTVLSANAVGVPCYFWVRRPDRVEDENGVLYLTLRIKENEYFEPQLQQTTFCRIVVRHPEEPNWWDPTIFGEFSERAYSVYFTKFYWKQRDEETDMWYRYFLPLYGELMEGVRNNGWTGEPLLFLPYLKEHVLVPMFDAYQDEIAVPEWYREYKESGNII